MSDLSSCRDSPEIAAQQRISALAAIRGASGSVATLYSGGTVVTMDPATPDLASGDVLVADGVVKAVGSNLAHHELARSAVAIDCRGLIVAPGLIDAHRHAWQTAFRRLIADADLDAYVASIHGGMALHYEPADMEIGTLVSVLSAMESGITTLLDFSHNSRSSAHSDAAFAAYHAAGARVVHASAAPNAGDWDNQWPADLVRLKDEHCQPGLTSLRMGLDIKRVRPVEDLLANAREGGIGITFDGVLGPRASDEIESLAHQGLLGPDITLIHCTDVTSRVWDAIVDTGTNVTLAVTADEHIGIASGIPPIQRCLDLGLKASLSTDVEVTLAGDMFTQMRTVLATQRMMASHRRFQGEDEPPDLMSSREALALATVNGAAHLGLGSVTGRLAPGYQADLILLRAEDLATMPLNNAIGTIVQGCGAAQVEGVVVAGRPRKWSGAMLDADLPQLRGRLLESRDRSAARVGWQLDPLKPPSFRAARDASLRAHVDGTQAREKEDQ